MHPKRNAPYTLILIIALVALGLRVWAALRFSYWGDEGFSCIAIKDFGEALHYLSYTMLNRLVYSVFGMNYFVLRLVSVVYGTLAVVTFFFFLDLIIGRRAAIVGSLALCLSPLAIQISGEIRNYSFFLMNIIVSAYLLELYIRKPRRLWLWLYLLHLPVLLTSHMLALLLSLVQALRWLNSRNHRLFHGAVAMALVGMTALALGRDPLFKLLWPIIGGHQQNFLAAAESRSLSPLSFVKAVQAMYVFVFGFGVPVGVYSAVSSSLLLMLVLGRFRRVRTYKYLLLWTLVPIVFVYVVLDAIVPSFFPAAQAKYALVSMPAFLTILVISATPGANVYPGFMLICLMAINTGMMFAGSYNQYAFYITDYAGGIRKFREIDSFVVTGPNRFSVRAESWKQKRSISMLEPVVSAELPRELVIVTGGWKEKDIAADNELLGKLHQMGYRAIDSHSSFNIFFFRLSRNARPSPYFQPIVGDIRYRYMQFPMRLDGYTSLYYADLKEPLRVTLPPSRKVKVYYLLTSRPSGSQGGISAVTGPTPQSLSTGQLRDWRRAGSVFSFYKFFDSVGGSKYPGAYRSFSAHIHKAELSANRPFSELTLSATPGHEVAIIGVRTERSAGALPDTEAAE